jgi:poly-gamma-glutamate capsule biosynthesis protein CapA/YwtB (metallophosphatase superfamily)
MSTAWEVLIAWIPACAGMTGFAWKFVMNDGKVINRRALHTRARLFIVCASSRYPGFASMFKHKSLFLLPLLLLAAACSAPVGKPAAGVAPPPAASGVSASGLSGAPSMQIKFAVAGDVMAHGPQIAAAYDKQCDCYDFKPAFATAAPLFKDVDVAIANLETTLPGKNYSGYPQFGAPDALVDGATSAGINLFLNANNHCLDKGKEGVLRTLQVLDEKKIPHLGTYASEKDYEQNRVFLLKKNGLTVALLNYTYGTNGFKTPPGVVVDLIDKANISTDIAKAREMHVDAVIVFFHFGKEYLNKPDAYQREMVAHALASGADIVIGGHPHHAQPYELFHYEGQSAPHLVAYSLGNFVSAQRQPYTDGGMVLYFTLSKKADAKEGAAGQPQLEISDVHHKLVWVYISHEGERKQFRILPVEQSLAEQDRLKLPPEAIAGMTAYRDAVEAVLKNNWVSPATRTSAVALSQK